MKTDAQPNSSPGIFDCIFPAWYSNSKPYFESVTRSFYDADRVNGVSELVSTALIGWGDILSTTLENGMRVAQKGFEIGKASLTQEGVDPEPLFEAVDSANREIHESFEPLLKNSPMAPALEAVEAVKSSLKVFAPEQDAFRKRMKKWVVFQLKISKVIKDWSDRSWTDAQSLYQDDHAWEEAAQKMISAQSEWVRGMVDDFQMPEEVKSQSMPMVDEYTAMLEKGLSVLATGSNLMNRTWRAAAESWGELCMSPNGNGDLTRDGFKAFQERYEQVVRKAVQDSRIAEMLPQWVYTGHELNTAAGQWRNRLMFWPVTAETDSKAPAPFSRKTKGGLAENSASPEPVVVD